MNEIKSIVITGGHHTSALPVIDLLTHKYPDIDIAWIGHKYSMKGDKNPTLEYQEITLRKIPFYHLSAGKVYRTTDLVRLLKVPFGFIQSFILLIKIKPDVILSFGGYLAAPVVFSGWLLGIPSVTHEQTVVAGYANRFISLFAKKILYSWPSSKKYFPENKSFFVGLPIRKQLFEINGSNYEANPDLPTVYITAGKTGSHKINRIVDESLSELLKFTNIIHQCGDNSVHQDYDRLLDRYNKIKNGIEGGGIYHLRKFISGEEIGAVYAKADAVISRSGAHTITELLILEKPCLLIPIPWVSHNEQYENALIVKNSGLGIILEEKELTPSTFVSSVRDVLSNIGSYKIKDRSIITDVNLNAAEEIITHLKSIKS